MTVYIIIAVALALGIGSSFVFKKDDSLIEELSEGVIEEQLGIPAGSLDLTPNSPENKLDK